MPRFFMVEYKYNPPQLLIETKYFDNVNKISYHYFVLWIYLWSQSFKLSDTE